MHRAAAAAWEAQQMGVTREKGLDASRAIPSHWKIKCQAWGVPGKAFPVAAKERRRYFARTWWNSLTLCVSRNWGVLGVPKVLMPPLWWDQHNYRQKRGIPTGIFGIEPPWPSSESLAPLVILTHIKGFMAESFTWRMLMVKEPLIIKIEMKKNQYWELGCYS